ncbi:MAG TPA: 4Fe-4S binding protein [Elusimicrobiales bacterium]|nr:4Fe-4S binding protein [Elusimicrobiales bacterium]
MAAKPGRALLEALKCLVSKPVTVSYPAGPDTTTASFRGRIVFDQDKCIGCRMCVKDCPAKAIEITPIEPEQYKFSYVSKSSRQKMPVAVPKFGKRAFTCVIDLNRCIFCAQCAYVCPKQALASSKKFDLACFDKKTVIDVQGKPAERKGKYRRGQ